MLILISSALRDPRDSSGAAGQSFHAYVRFGSKAASAIATCGVRFVPESGLEAERSACPLRANKRHRSPTRYQGIGVAYRRAAARTCRRSAKSKAAFVPPAGEQSEINSTLVRSLPHLQKTLKLVGNAMKLRRRQFLHLAVGAAALPAMPRVASAFDYP